MILATTEAGDGPPLILLHGLFGAGQNWGAIRRALAPRFRVLTPGSGVGNHRSALTAETLGVKVIAIGVPTVIYASTLVRDAQDSQDSEDSQAESPLGDMIVTPREVDEMIAQIAQLLAMGINRALHPGLSEREIAAMMG